MSLTMSAEDYLETILLLEGSAKKVKSVQIASAMAVSKPAVNKAMNELKEKGLIVKDDYTGIALTDEGRALAKQVYAKHTVIRSFLIKIGVSEATATIDCCKMEHIVSEETITRLAEFCKKEIL